MADEKVAEERWQSESRGFTPEDVAALVDEAWARSADAQGSLSGPTWGDSQTLQDDRIHDAEGSGPSEVDSSHEMRLKMSAAVGAWRAQFAGHAKIGDMGGLIEDALVLLGELKVCRPRSMTGGKAMFPLPVAGHPLLTGPGAAFLRALLASLNSMHGVACSSRANSTSVRVVKRLQQVLDVSPIAKEVLTPINFTEFFSSRGLSYEGEEVKVAKKVIWESISPSLPGQVGSLDIRDFCSAGVLYYINHFESFLVSPGDQFLGKPPRVHCDEMEWPLVAEGLLQRGICTLRKKSQLHHIQGSPLMSGLFAVSKDEFIDVAGRSIEVCRLIMNFKPLNSNCRQLEGDTGTLPMVTNLSGVFLDDGDVLCTSSEDLRCFFYLFALPEAWLAYTGFGKPVPASLCGDLRMDEDVFLCARVLPMGFLNSVGIAQHIHRNVVRRAMGSFWPVVGDKMSCDATARSLLLPISSGFIWTTLIN